MKIQVSVSFLVDTPEVITEMTSNIAAEFTQAVSKAYNLGVNTSKFNNTNGSRVITSYAIEAFIPTRL